MSLGKTIFSVSEYFCELGGSSIEIDVCFGVSCHRCKCRVKNGTGSGVVPARWLIV